MPVTRDVMLSFHTTFASHDNSHLSLAFVALQFDTTADFSLELQEVHRILPEVCRESPKSLKLVSPKIQPQWQRLAAGLNFEVINEKGK